MRASAVLLATAGLCIASLLSRTALAADARGAWSDLWHTPDQQGQALLDAGQPAQAADLFRDPRRRAYADLQAGRYEAAAKQLASFDDPRSEYNRGNALARSGNLQAALTAYDAALKHAPADADTRHNRELVERALQQQQHQSQQPRSGNGRQGQQPGQSGAQKPGGSGSQRSGKGSQSAGGGQPGANGSQAGANRPGNGAQQHATANGSNSAGEAPGQAQRDAAQAAALARAQRERGANGKTAQGQDSQQREGMEAGGTNTPKQPPESERQLALDQWLRQIPDSAAGLLQRKFLIEHMMRQQDGGQ